MRPSRSAPRSGPRLKVAEVPGPAPPKVRRDESGPQDPARAHRPRPLAAAQGLRRGKLARACREPEGSRPAPAHHGAEGGGSLPAGVRRAAVSRGEARGAGVAAMPGRRRPGGRRAAGRPARREPPARRPEPGGPGRVAQRAVVKHGWTQRQTPSGSGARSPPCSGRSPHGAAPGRVDFVRDAKLAAVLGAGPGRAQGPRGDRLDGPLARPNPGPASHSRAGGRASTARLFTENQIRSGSRPERQPTALIHGESTAPEAGAVGAVAPAPDLIHGESSPARLFAVKPRGVDEPVYLVRAANRRRREGLRRLATPRRPQAGGVGA